NSLRGMAGRSCRSMSGMVEGSIGRPELNISGCHQQRRNSTFLHQRRWTMDERINSKGAMRFVARALAVSLLGIGSLVHAAEIKVGVIVPLSGPVAAQGLSTLECLKAGVQYKNSVNGHTLNIIQLDDASNPSMTNRNA